MTDQPIPREEIERWTALTLRRETVSVHGDMVHVPASVFDELNELCIAMQKVLPQIQSEPDRIAAARREGYREGIEGAEEAANGIEPDILVGKGEGYVSTYCRARVDAAKAIRALAPPPTWAPTHRHYKGGLYRELMRVECPGGGETIVVYEAEGGTRRYRPAAEFDGYVDGYPDWVPGRRFDPIQPEEPTDAN